MGSQATQSLGFGLEIELLLIRKADFKPLSYEDLDCEELLSIVAEINTDDIGRDGMNTKPLHRGPTHYLIEGYTLTDNNFEPQSLMPKGIEVRTPICNSVKESLRILQDLYTRLESILHTHGMRSATLAHHPNAPDLHADRNYEREDYWQWAQTVTTTYGPDVNISVPVELQKYILCDNLHARINYYAPSMVALSCNSPLYLGDLFKVHGEVGHSARTFRRSIWAPLYYIHRKPELRFEFKGFEMSPFWSDYEAFTLCSMALLLDEQLQGAATDQERIYDCGIVGVRGISPDFVRDRAEQILQAAERIGSRFGIDTKSLDSMHKRIQAKRTPSHKVIELFNETGDVVETLKRIPHLTQIGEAICASNP